MLAPHAHNPPVQHHLCGLVDTPMRDPVRPPAGPSSKVRPSHTTHPPHPARTGTHPRTVVAGRWSVVRCVLPWCVVRARRPVSAPVRVRAVGSSAVRERHETCVRVAQAPPDGT